MRGGGVVVRAIESLIPQRERDSCGDNWTNTTRSDVSSRSDASESVLHTTTSFRIVRVCRALATLRAQFPPQSRFPSRRPSADRSTRDSNEADSDSLALIASAVTEHFPDGMPVSVDPRALFLPASVPFSLETGRRAFEERHAIRDIGGLAGRRASQEFKHGEEAAEGQGSLCDIGLARNSTYARTRAHSGGIMRAGRKGWADEGRVPGGCGRRERNPLWRERVGRGLKITHSRTVRCALAATRYCYTLIAGSASTPSAIGGSRDCLFLSRNAIGDRGRRDGYLFSAEGGGGLVSLCSTRYHPPFFFTGNSGEKYTCRERTARIIKTRTCERADFHAGRDGIHASRFVGRIRLGLRKPPGDRTAAWLNIPRSGIDGGSTAIKMRRWLSGTVSPHDHP